MPKFKMGARVWDVRQGLGTVQTPTTCQPLVEVRFDNGLTGYYMRDGRVNENDYVPSLYLSTHLGPHHYVETFLTPPQPTPEVPALTIGTPVLVRNWSNLKWQFDFFLKMLEPKYAADTKSISPQHECLYGVWAYCVPLTEETRYLYGTTIPLQQSNQDATKDLTLSEPIKAPEMTCEKAVELLKLRESELAHYQQVCDKLADRLYAVCGRCPARTGLSPNLSYPYPTWCRALDEGTDKFKCRGSKNGENCWVLFYSAFITDRNNS